MSKFHSVKDSDFINDVCTLAKNTPKLVFPKHNSKRFAIHEEKNNETLFVIFDLAGDEHALIGHECHRPKQNGCESAKTDLMCIYIKPSRAVNYAYELKKTLGGKDVILGLLSQWAETISYCKTLITKPDCEFVVGVITEELNENLLNSGIKELLKRTERTGSELKNSSAARKRLAFGVNAGNTLKRLTDF